MTDLNFSEDDDNEPEIEKQNEENIFDVLNNRTFSRLRHWKLVQKYQKDLNNFFNNIDKFTINSLFYGNEKFLLFFYSNDDFKLLMNNKLCFLMDLDLLKIFVDYPDFYPNYFKIYFCDNFFERIIFFKKYFWKGSIYLRKSKEKEFSEIIINFLKEQKIFFVPFREKIKNSEKNYKSTIFV